MSNTNLRENASKSPRRSPILSPLRVAYKLKPILFPSFSKVPLGRLQNLQKKQTRMQIILEEKDKRSRVKHTKHGFYKAIPLRNMQVLFLSLLCQYWKVNMQLFLCNKCYVCLHKHVFFFVKLCFSSTVTNWLLPCYLLASFYMQLYVSIKMLGRCARDTCLCLGPTPAVHQLAGEGQTLQTGHIALIHTPVLL